VIAFHPTKKIQVEEWVDAVDSGVLTAVIKQGRPARARYPHRVLCDNEGFLSAAESKAAHRKQKVNLWHVPPHSPDLNVIEKYWSWLRRELQRRDLNDLVKKRLPLGKMAYRQRILAICRSPKSKTVAANIFQSFRKVCKEVLQKRGAMARC
jgi:transposase